MSMYGEIPKDLEPLLKEDNKFTAPTVQEVETYLRECSVREPKANAEKFVNFYEAKGWMIGKNKMKNWKSAVSTWRFEKNNLIL